MIEQDNFTYSLLIINKHYIIMTEGQVEKQIKGDEEHGKQLVKANVFVEEVCHIVSKKKFSLILVWGEWIQ